ncbi:MAG TPA: hypothetical protein VHU14_05070 [Solirubrobacterales bacterium]|nr:hypothetical protein [Solirubrobacterales bacterium]
MDKDRESVHPIAGTDNAQIVYRRSSARPVEYAILLQVRGAKGWETRVVADNSHADRHAKVIDWFAESWTELTS